MARILVISSQVVSGHVGLSAMQPALQALGHDVLALPTIVLSNHPGQQPASGTRIEPAVLATILETLDTNGRLNQIDAVLTGYLPSVAHVDVAAAAIIRCRRHNPNARILCDPVLGDDPKGLYIDPAAANAIRATLMPLADILTPNRFELAWLTGQTVENCATAVAAARTLNRPLVIATSIPAASHSATAQLATLAIGAHAVAEAIVPRRAHAPNGTGDLLAALFLAGYLAPDATPAAVLAQAVAWVDAVLAASNGDDELDLSALWPNRNA